MIDKDDDDEDVNLEEMQEMLDAFAMTDHDEPHHPDCHCPDCIMRSAVEEDILQQQIKEAKYGESH